MTVRCNCLLCGSIESREFLAFVRARDVKNERLRDCDLLIRSERKALLKLEDLRQGLALVASRHNEVPIGYLTEIERLQVSEID